MHVLIASSMIDRKNGYGNITYELCRALIQKNVQVTLLLPHNDLFKEHDIEGVRVLRILPTLVYNYGKRALLEYPFWRLPKNIGTFDVYHAIFASPYAPLIAREARKNGKPLIVGAQGTYGVKGLYEFPERFFLKSAYKQAQAIHVPSEYTKQAIILKANESYDIDIIHNGVDFERFNKMIGVTGKNTDKYKDNKIILTVGELKNRKGQDIVIKALPKVLHKHPEVRYILVGNDGWNGYLQKLAKEMGVSDNIDFVGSVPAENVAEYFAVADIYVHTPRVIDKIYFEGFGIVYLEAGACGKPSVATDAGGIKDAVIHNQTGFIAENEDVEGVAQYIIELLDNSDKRKNFGVQAIEYARMHTWDRITDQYIDMYKKVINE